MNFYYTERGRWTFTLEISFCSRLNKEWGYFGFLGWLFERATIGWCLERFYEFLFDCLKFKLLSKVQDFVKNSKSIDFIPEYLRSVFRDCPSINAGAKNQIFQWFLWFLKKFFKGIVHMGMLNFILKPNESRQKLNFLLKTLCKLHKNSISNNSQ